MKQTEKRERRLIVRFILIVLACGVLGYFVGMFMAEYGGNIRPLPQSAMESITRMFPFLFAGYNLVLFAACLIINRKAKGLLAAWDGEEETVLDTIEHLLNYPILLSNIALILNLFAFPLSIQLAEWTDLGKKTEGFGILAVLVIFLLGYVWILAVQNAALKMEKTMKIEGMMCGHCEARVKKTLEGIEGVTEAKVSHTAGTAIVTLSAPVADEVLKKAVEDQDYKVLSIG